MIELKYCPKCKKKKEIDEFHKNKSNKSGHADYCKLCSNASHRHHYATSPEYRRKLKISSGKNCCFISNEEYAEKFNLQKGKCAICGRHQNEINKALGTDHNHTTGKFRGLLCNNCNLALGNLRDNIELLKAAIVYLEIYEKTPISN